MTQKELLMRFRFRPKSMSGDQFNAWLEKFELTQSGFARMVDVDGRTVRRWALGERHVPDWMERFFINLQNERGTRAFAELMKFSE